MDEWRLLPYDVGSSVRHIELSDALVREGREPTIWWHATDEATLILGARQTPEDMAGRASTPVVRRQSGGTAVFAASGVLGLDIFLPRGHDLIQDDIVESYRWLGELWQKSLATLGIDGHLVTIDEARQAPVPPPLVRQACFGSLSPFEVTVADRKMVGLAQVRRGNGVLLQSGIHLLYDATGLASLIAPEDVELPALLRAAGVGLSELRREIDESQVQSAFQRTLQRVRGIDLKQGAWTREELTRANC